MHLTRNATLLSAGGFLLRFRSPWSDIFQAKLFLVTYGEEKMKMLKNFIRNEEGASAVEYALLVGGIAAVVMTMIYALGGSINSRFAAVNTQLAS
jgi:pilus assembly protein Flp/PilA